MTEDEQGIGAAAPIAVLTNRLAGRGRFRGLLPVVLERLGAAGREIRVLTPDSRDAALAQCHAAVSDGVEALIAVGGDGTVHLAIQAVAGTKVAFGAIPAGTGNDFVTEIGLPRTPVEAAQAVAVAVRDGHRRAVDLARVTGPDGYTAWFGAVLGAGFDAIVNERANAMRFPRGPRRYDIAIVIELLRLRPRRYTLTLDGVPHRVDAVLVAVGNTASYGGGMRICPTADPNDGLLDVVIAGKISRTTLMRIKPRVYKGTHVDHPQVSQYRATTVTLAAEGITAYLDGERGCPLPITITAVPGALNLLG